MGGLQIGQLYRHFKGEVYQVICTAEHSETGEMLVIYQAMYGEFKVYARSEKQFFEVLDKEKYPDSKQVHRFELIEKKKCDRKSCEGIQTGAEEINKIGKIESEYNSEEGGKGLSVIMQFLEAGTSKEKLEIIKINYSKIDERTINNIEASMDIVSDTDDLDARISYVCDVLKTKSQYENTRLRT